MPMMTERDHLPDFLRRAIERKRKSVELPEPSERRRLREAFGLSQDDIAQELGVSRKTVSTWETGRSNPSGDRLTQYAELLSSLTRLEKERGNDEGQ